MKKVPQIEKIYEAWSALADGRVKEIVPGKTYRVTSSDGKRIYTVDYDPEGPVYYSNDNATYWRGYAGYPVLAVMMYRGELPYPEGAREWEGVNWTVLNKEKGRNYAAAVAQIEKERGLDSKAARGEAEKAMLKLSDLPYETRRLMKVPVLIQNI